MNSIPKEALDEYIGETQEMCGRVTVNLGLIEKNAHEAKTLNSIYRDMHSIKGSSHLFGFRQIGALAHTIETALDPIRERQGRLDADSVDVLYAGLDLITKMLQSIIVTGGEDPRYQSEADALTPRIAAIATKINDEIVVTHDDAQVSPDVRGRLTRDEHIAESGTLRIPVGVLDHLMSLIGELVLVRNQVSQYLDEHSTGELQKISQRLSAVTSEIQMDVMKTRMQPISHLLTQFPRLVRDMSRELGKKVDLQIIGAETELDKAMIEAVRDPLTHIVRNSLDHGLEKPEDRRRLGKAEKGLLCVRAHYDGGQVQIEVSDDGRGLSKLRIGRKAVEQGIISEEQLAKITEREVHALVFVPGFSTADNVSNISGRGVGMDVVKTNIEQIGGSVGIHSTAGIGTTVRLKIPLTLAIVPAIMVKSVGQIFAIPQAKIIELIQVGNRHGEGPSLESLQGQIILNIRGQILPVIDLAGTLGVGNNNHYDSAIRQDSNVVLVQYDGGSYALLVDHILDRVDIVIKPVTPQLKRLKVYSGSTILGDGTVVLVLDVSEVYRKKALAQPPGQTMGYRPAEDSQSKLLGRNSLGATCDYLWVKIGLSGLFLLPLCVIHRLEEFPSSAIQWSGNLQVIRYRDSFLPLIDLARELCHNDPVKPSESLATVTKVVVISKMGRYFGFVVTEISDVIKIDANVDFQMSEHVGVMGSIIYNQRVYSVVDTHRIIDHLVQMKSGSNGSQDAVLSPAVDGMHLDAQVEAVRRRRRSQHRLLLAEDTMFFRRHVKAFLEGCGYEVVAVNNGDEALQGLDANISGKFSLLITDIEMPIMDGFTLATMIRRRHDLAKFPIVALSSKFTQVDIDHGLSVGISKYIEKLNSDELLASIDQLLGVDAITENP